MYRTLPLAIAFALAATGAASAETPTDQGVGPVGTMEGPASQVPGGVVPAEPRIGETPDPTSQDRGVGPVGTMEGPASQLPGGEVSAFPRIGMPVTLEELDADGDGSIGQEEFAQFETEHGTLYRRKQEGESADTPALTEEPGMRDNYSKDIGAEEVPPTGSQ